MSAADADLILSNPERYPMMLIAVAESRREQHEQSLYAVARDRRWFEQEYWRRCWGVEHALRMHL
ncbi:hypothetical protein ACWFR5_27530 [Streptomyces sp. NPDC055092]